MISEEADGVSYGVLCDSYFWVLCLVLGVSYVGLWEHNIHNFNFNWTLNNQALSIVINKIWRHEVWRNVFKWFLICNSQKTFFPSWKFNRSESGFELSLPENHPSQNKKSIVVHTISYNTITTPRTPKKIGKIGKIWRGDDVKLSFVIKILGRFIMTTLTAWLSLSPTLLPWPVLCTYVGYVS